MLFFVDRFFKIKYMTNLKSKWSFQLVDQSTQKSTNLILRQFQTLFWFRKLKYFDQF